MSSVLIKNLMNNIDAQAELPELVFRTKFDAFYAFDVERVLSAECVRLINALNAIEQSDRAGIAVFEMSIPSDRNWMDDIFFVDERVSEEDYWQFVLGKKGATQPELPWHTYAWVLGACSEKGEWCIYGSRSAEFAILALRRMEVSVAIRDMFWLTPLWEAAGNNDDARFQLPTDRTPGKEFTAKLLSNYYGSRAPFPTSPREM